MCNKDDIAVIVLAAGNASRMGYAKQLLNYKGKSLISHAVEVAQKVTPSACYVVLGAYQDEIKADLAGSSCRLVIHDDWKRGMGSSLKAGVKALQAQHPQAQAVLIMVADQPFVNENLLLQMINEQLVSGKGMVACRYGEAWGTPVIFMPRYVEQLLDLPDDAGAKKLLMQQLQDVAFVDFPQGAIDVDTEEDYNKLNKHD